MKVQIFPYSNLETLQYKFIDSCTVLNLYEAIYIIYEISYITVKHIMRLCKMWLVAKENREEGKKTLVSFGDFSMHWALEDKYEAKSNLNVLGLPWGLERTLLLKYFASAQRYAYRILRSYMKRESHQPLSCPTSKTQTGYFCCLWKLWFFLTRK